MITGQLLFYEKTPEYADITNNLIISFFKKQANDPGEF